MYVVVKVQPLEWYVNFRENVLYIKKQETFDLNFQYRGLCAPLENCPVDVNDFLSASCAQTCLLSQQHKS